MCSWRSKMFLTLLQHGHSSIAVFGEPYHHKFSSNLLGSFPPSFPAGLTLFHIRYAPHNTLLTPVVTMHPPNTLQVCTVFIQRALASTV